MNFRLDEPPALTTNYLTVQQKHCTAAQIQLYTQKRYKKISKSVTGRLAIALHQDEQ